MLIRQGGFPSEEKCRRAIWEKNTSGGKHTEGEIAHFVSCVLSGERPITDGRTSTTGLRVIWKLYEAEMEGRVADLSDVGFDRPFIETPICHFDCDSEEALYKRSQI